MKRIDFVFWLIKQHAYQTLDVNWSPEWSITKIVYNEHLNFPLPYQETRNIIIFKGFCLHKGLINGPRLTKAIDTLFKFWSSDNTNVIKILSARLRTIVKILVNHLWLQILKEERPSVINNFKAYSLWDWKHFYA